MSYKGCVSNYVGEVLVICPQDRRIDDGDYAKFLAELTELVAKAKHRKVLVNFDVVDYVPSSIVGALFKVNKQCRASEIALKFCGCRKVVKEIFDLFGMHRLVDTHEQESEALSAFDKKAGWFS